MQGFISQNIRTFLLLEQESSISENMKNLFGVNFLGFLGFDWEMRQVALICLTIDVS